MSDLVGQEAGRPLSATARRMRDVRERRRLGLRCVTIEVSDAEVQALVDAGFLPSAGRNDRTALAVVMGTLLDRVPLARIIELSSGGADISVAS
jgi:hypothetical protein